MTLLTDIQAMVTALQSIPAACTAAQSALSSFSTFLAGLA